MISPRFIPHEIIDLIIPHLWEISLETPPLRVWEVDKKPNSRGLASYATISRTWQFAIERYTFASIMTCSDDLPRLKRIVGDCARRRSHVKELWFSINLLPYSESRRYFVERPEEHQANLAAFQQGIQDLWGELSRWSRECHPSGIRLVLNADARINRDAENNEHLVSDGLTARWQYPDHFLSLGQDTRLPSLPAISELGVGFEGRYFHPSAIETLILSLPAVRRLHLFVGAPQPRNHELRAEHRAILAQALGSHTLRQLEFLSVSMEYSTPNNHSWDMSPAHDPYYPEGDVLNRAICKLAQRSLRFLNLMDGWPISPALWGAGDQDDASNSAAEIVFPCLETVYVQHSHITYDGRWFYTGHPEAPPPSSGHTAAPPIYIDYPSPLPIEAADNSNPEALGRENTIDRTRHLIQNADHPFHEWRVRPDPEMYNPLLRSLMRAVLQMPRLKSLWVELYTKTLLSNRIMMQVVAPGEKAGVLRWTRRLEDDLGRWRWIVLVEEDLNDMLDWAWKVPADVYPLMREMVGEDGAVLVQRFP
ncbi:hypothetical protein BJX66DRAFT_91332 [Aspergillus keveii]|uniref:F-box domain protein n=1 Tax=Aspergillus keveii TaxID=714993 RepID=A0ABR4FLW1_9EURO